MVLASAHGSAQIRDDLDGSYSAVTARDPEELSVLKLRRLGGMDYSLDLHVVAPNRTHHTGQLDGVAVRDGDILTLVKQNLQPDGKPDFPAICRLKIEVDAGIAVVLSDDGCAGYAGAGASFFEQGRELRRR